MDKKVSSEFVLTSVDLALHGRMFKETKFIGNIRPNKHVILRFFIEYLSIYITSINIIINGKIVDISI